MTAGIQHVVGDRWTAVAPAATATVAERVDDPTFSVVIAAFNAAHTARDAAISALTQTTPPHEVIVVDDGSTDDLQGALVGLSDEVRIIRRDNGGEGAAKGLGARAASGEFVAFLDADDVYEPERLAALTWLARARPDLDLLLTDAYLEEGGVISGRCYRDAMVFDCTDQVTAILTSNFLIGHLAVRRSSLQECGGFSDDMRAVADWEAWIRVILAGGRAGLVEAPLSRYRLHDAGISGDRARLTRWKAVALRRALRSPHLTTDQRVDVLARAGAFEREAALVDAEQQLSLGRPARERLHQIARDRTQPANVRIRASCAAVAPRVARHLIHRRERHGDSRLRRVPTRRSPASPQRPPAARVVEIARLAVGGAMLHVLRFTPLRGGIAIMHHAIADRPGDRRRDIVPAASSSALAGQLRALRRHTRPVHASHLPDAIRRRRLGGPFPLAVTFDDDLRCHLTEAAPVLRRFNVPATFFLSGASLVRPSTHWWEDLQAVLDQPSSSLDELSRVLRQHGVDAEPTASIREFARAIEALPPSSRGSIGTLLREARGPGAPMGGLDHHEVNALSRLGHEVGFHTRRHDRLTDLPDHALTRNLTEGRGALATASGRRLTAIAYPHGRADDRVADAARRAGWVVGYTGGRGVPTARTPALMLPRIDAAVLSPGTLLLTVARLLLGELGPALRSPLPRRTSPRR